MFPSIHPPTSKSIADLGPHGWSWASRAHGSSYLSASPGPGLSGARTYPGGEVLQGLEFWNSQARWGGLGIHWPLI